MARGASEGLSIVNAGRKARRYFSSLWKKASVRHFCPSTADSMWGCLEICGSICVAEVIISDVKFGFLNIRSLFATIRILFEVQKWP